MTLKDFKKLKTGDSVTLIQDYDHNNPEYAYATLTNNPRFVRGNNYFAYAKRNRDTKVVMIDHRDLL